MISIRPETDRDAQAIRAVNEAAFGTAEEADLVDAVRAAGLVLLSLVAEADGRIVGHVLFSRMWIRTVAGSIDAVALAPMAIVPECQKQGIGTRLIWQALETLRDRRERIVIVVGHPAYYPRFGFSSQTAASLESPFPREAFMALELVPQALDGIAGTVEYPDAVGL